MAQYFCKGEILFELMLYTKVVLKINVWLISLLLSRGYGFYKTFEIVHLDKKQWPITTFLYFERTINLCQVQAFMGSIKL